MGNPGFTSFKNISLTASLTLLLTGLASAPAFAEFEPMLDPKAMDLSVDPCTDFFQYSCGKWIENNPIPEDKSSVYRSFTSINEENWATNRMILEDFAAGKNLGLSANSKKLADFYSACVDTSKISAQGQKFLDSQFARFDSLNTTNLSKIVGDIQNDGLSVFFAFGSIPNFDDSSQTIAVITQGGMGLPSRDHYFEQKHEEIRKKYVEHIAKMLSISGTEATQAEKDAKDIFAFETALAEKALRPDETRDPKATFHLMTRAELTALAPAIQWDLFFSSAGSPSTDKIDVMEPKFFSNLSELILHTPVAVLKAYLRWQMINTFASDLSGKWGDEDFEFSGKILSGKKKMPPRWKYCVNETDKALVDALGEAFVAKTFGTEGKTKALGILDTIQKAFAKNFSTLSWMDDSTRQFAINKLGAFLKKIGYPDKWKDLSELTVGQDHMANVLASSKFRQALDMAKIGKPTDRAEWRMTPPTVNAYYNPNNNEIVFPAGILQSPMFSTTAPNAANYGAFGAVIGHEMTHAFDDEGRQFDQIGNLRDWWSPGIGDVFDQKAKCIVDQYANYTVANGIHLNGKLTLGENIADLGGVKMALAGFESTLASTLSETERTEELKKFFTSFGQVWCGQATPELQAQYATTDPHSPPKYRVNGVLVNIPEFAKTFGCAAGKPMAPANRCSVW